VVRATHEAIAFADIGPLAGGYHGLYYLHHVTDAASRQSLLIAPGMWLMLHARPQPTAAQRVVRLAILGEGHTILADGTAATTSGPAQIDAVSPMPVDLASARPITDERTSVPLSDALPEGVSADVLSDVNAILRPQIADQRVQCTTTITIANHAGIEERLRGMPFTLSNPESLGLQCSFWLQMLADPARRGHELLRLQYSQTILIQRDGIGWPHISLATLLKQER
jgi:hypothetical protein